MGDEYFKIINADRRNIKYYREDCSNTILETIINNIEWISVDNFYLRTFMRGFCYWSPLLCLLLLLLLLIITITKIHGMKIKH
jgi:hypothetical protein